MKLSDQHARRIADYLLRDGELLLRVKPPQDSWGIGKVHTDKQVLGVMLLDYESAVTSEMIAEMPD